MGVPSIDRRQIAGLSLKLPGSPEKAMHAVQRSPMMKQPLGRQRRPLRTGLTPERCADTPAAAGPLTGEVGAA
jgi:hypothetical protein